MKSKDNTLDEEDFKDEDEDNGDELVEEEAILYAITVAR